MSNLRQAAQQALEALELPEGLNNHEEQVLGIACAALRAALENEFNPDWDQVVALQEYLREHTAQIQRLRAALAEDALQRLTDVQQEMELVIDCPRCGHCCPQQHAEPVAWMYDFLNTDNSEEVIRNWVTQDFSDIDREKGFNVRPLYTAPPQRLPLTIKGEA